MKRKKETGSTVKMNLIANDLRWGRISGNVVCQSYRLPVTKKFVPFPDRLYVNTRLKESGIKTVMLNKMMAREIFQCVILDLLLIETKCPPNLNGR